MGAFSSPTLAFWSVSDSTNAGMRSGSARNVGSIRVGIAWRRRGPIPKQKGMRSPMQTETDTGSIGNALPFDHEVVEHTNRRNLGLLWGVKQVDGKGTRT